ncbi:hypothetical protein [Bacillus sp. es.036]|uniref:hypothetical protein n=1 Tax=Bacillus sp. es.036 TaxID=1761764 RepID=UPI000BF443F4|nr:hypothetical protein [Bacillus sp. es.036]PFG12287.1 hypothetical protein ATG70_0464 [Bacillus sp. es.036]
MQISEYFNLEQDQTDLEFVNVDTSRDVELFIDPWWLHISTEDEWCRGASVTLTGFFDHIIGLYEQGEINRARELFDFAHEPNETCFGLSSNNPEGTGASADMLAKVFDNITSNAMIENGLVTRLEDLHVFVSDFGQDRLSDLVTNVIRKHLVDYTKEQCGILGIELDEEITNLGHYWNEVTNEWEVCNDRALKVNDKQILLVPKKIVVKNYRYNASQYCTHYVLARRQEYHKQVRSNLVKETTRRDGTKKIEVYKKDIREEEITQGEKQYVIDITMENGDLIQRFRDEIAGILRDSKRTNKLSDQDLMNIFDEEL